MQQSSNRGKRGSDRRHRESRDRSIGDRREEGRRGPMRKGEGADRRVFHGRDTAKKAFGRNGTARVTGPGKVVKMSRSIDALDLIKSIRNLGPGADVWTRVKSMLISEKPQLSIPSVCNGFEDIQIEWTRGSNVECERMIERIRWYEHG